MTNRKAELFIDSQHELAEGPFWHGGRQQLFWFDIIGRTLNAANPDGEIEKTWAFDEPVSAAGLLDDDTLLVASASGLNRLSLTSGTHELVVPIEQDDRDTRSNDGRVDRAGGFWTSTMSLSGDNSAGSIYQYRRGKVKTMRTPVGIPNAICFAPDGRTAYCTDTPTGIIVKCPTDPETGAPTGEWEEHIDSRDHPGHPDGAVVDSEGFLWSARWGGYCVIRYAPDGQIDRQIDVPVSNVSCPAFGGADLKTLFLTTAQEGLSAAERAEQKYAGGIFRCEVDVEGLPEVRIAF